VRAKIPESPQFSIGLNIGYFLNNLNFGTIVMQYIYNKYINNYNYFMKKYFSTLSINVLLLLVFVISLLLLTSFGAQAGKEIIVSYSKEIVPKNNSGRIFWNTNTKANCEVLLGAEPNLSDAVVFKGYMGNENIDTETGPQSFVALLSNVSPGVNYYQIRCIDDNGILIDETDIEEITNTQIDTSKMIIDSVRATHVTATSANIYMHTNNRYDCKVEYSDLSGNSGSEEGILNQSANPDNGEYFIYTAMVRDLKASTRYDYKIVCNDANNIIESKNYAFYTQMHNEDIVISDIDLVHVSDSSVKISWKTNMDTSYNYVMFYNQNSRTGRGYYEDKNQFKKEHEVIIPDLLTTGSYEYSIYSGLLEGGSVYAMTEYFGVSDNVGPTLNNPNVNRGAIDATEVVKVDKEFSQKLAGKILLQVESRGEAYYVNPKDNKKYYMSDGKSAFSIMRNLGTGISNNDLNKIPVVRNSIDSLEKIDSDGDGYNDKQELLNGYNPNGAGKLMLDASFSNKNRGRIFLQVESRGEAWYINPSDGIRYYLGTPNDAFNIMRQLGLGITNINLNKIATAKN